MKASNFKFNDWVVYWSGNWSVLSMSYWGEIYTGKPFTSEMDQCVKYMVIVWQRGKSEAFGRESEKEKFGRKFNALVKSNAGYMDSLFLKTKKATDQFLGFEKQHFGKDITIDQYKKFQNILNRIYYPLFIQNKISADYLDKDILDKYFSKIEKVRKYITPVFDRSEKFMIKLAKIHARKTGYDYSFILSTIKKEFEDYLSGKLKLPSKELLESRLGSTAFLSKDGKTEVLNGKVVEEIERIVSARNNNEVLKGSTGYPGKITGIARVIIDPKNPGRFTEGDILVSGATRPDFLSIMKKASGFVTDSGGLLCHAAIVARELKKPCVVGTQVATRVLKDGDLVEVDASKGIVRKITK